MCSRCNKQIQLSFFERHYNTGCTRLPKLCKFGCGVSLPPTSLNRHYRKFPNKSEQLIDLKTNTKCHHCNNYIPNPYYQDHVQNKCERLSVKCQYCDKTFSNLGLKIHLKSVHKVKKVIETKNDTNSFLCEFCKINILIKFRESHLLKCSKRLVKCDRCGKDLKFGCLKAHQGTQSCLNVQKKRKNVFDDSNEKETKKIKRSTDEQKCKLCNQTFNRNSVLKHHQLNTCIKRKVKCKYCNMSIFAKTVPRHHKSCEKKGPIRIIKCDCGAKFKERSKWVHDHFSCNLGPKIRIPVNCDSCGLRLNKRSLHFHKTYCLSLIHI